MPNPITFYATGTASVANGATTITFSGALLGTADFPTIQAGDLFFDPAQPAIPGQRIASVDYDAGTAELWADWPGTSMSGDAYEVRFTGDPVRSTAQTRRLLEAIGLIDNTGIGIDAYGAFTDRGSFDGEDAGFAFLSIDGDGALITVPVVFLRDTATAGVWSDPVLIQGPQGPQGDPSIIGLWRGAWVTATAYAVGDIVQQSGSSYRCKIAHTSGTFATDLAAGKWELTVSKGDPGNDGVFSAIASQAEAVDGTDDAVGMSPLRVRQAITGYPLKLNKLELLRAPGQHFWSGPIIFDAARRRWWVFFSSGWHHGASYGSSLQVMWSRDGFAQDRNAATIAMQDGWEWTPQFGVATVFPSGRVGIVIYGRSSSTSAVKFFYSDDGATWSKTDLSPSVAIVPTGEMHTLPNGDKILYGYGTVSGVTQMTYITIHDEGASFTSGACFASSPSAALAEPTVFEIGVNKWGMLARRDDSDQTTAYNAWGATSTDGTTWTTPVDSGVELGANPVKGIVDDWGTLWIHANFRGTFQSPDDASDSGTADGYGTPAGKGDVLGVMRTNALDFFNAGGVVTAGDRSWIEQDPWPVRNTGQINYCRDDLGKYWAIASTQELLRSNTDPAAEQMVMLLTPSAPVTPRIKATPTSYNELHNPFFRQRNASAGTTGTGKSFVTDRWLWDGNGSATATISFPTVSDEMRRLIPGRPNVAMGISSTGAAFSKLYQQRFGRAAVAHYSDRIGWLQLWLSGTIPANLYFVSSIDFGTGGSTSVSTQTKLAGAEPLTIGGTPLYRIARKVLLPSTDGKTFGSSTPTIQFALQDATSGGAHAWGCTLFAAKLSLNPDLDEIEYPDIEVENDLLDRYTEYRAFAANELVNVGWAPGAGVAVCALPWKQKVKTPVGTVLSPAAGDFVVNGINSDNATTIITPSLANGQLRMNCSGLASGAPYQVLAGSSAPPTIRITVE